jgi:hypothetical protein
MKKKLLLLLVVFLSVLDFQSHAQVVTTIGTGATTNTATSYPAPFGNYWWGARHQFLYTAAELSAAGLTAGSQISTLGFDVTTLNNTPTATTLSDWSMLYKFTTTADMTAWETGMLSAFASPTYTPAVGANDFSLPCAIVWDGTSNLVIETCFNNGSFTNNESSPQTTTTFTSARWYRADAAGVCGNAGQTGTGTSRTNLRLTYTNGTGTCALATAPVMGAVTSFTAEVLSVTDYNAPAAAGYDFEYVISGGSPSGTPQVSNVTLPYIIPGLADGITYDLYVRANCGASQGPWSLCPTEFTTPPTCLAPVNLTATSITSSTADISWVDSNAPATNNYDILLGLQGTLSDPNLTPQSPSIPNWNNDTFSLTNLPQNTCFDYYVRSNCSATDSSVWTGPYTFCTTLGCDSVYNVAVSSITATSAQLSWVDSNATAPPSWEIEIVPTGGTPTGVATDTATASPYTLMGLSSLTGYDVYIRAACGGAAGFSPWVGPTTFTTLIAPLNCTTGVQTTVFSEDFINATATQTAIPNAFAPGWTKSGAGPFWATDNNGFNSGGTGPISGANTPGYVYLESSTGAGEDTLISPAISLSTAAGAARVNFYYHRYGGSMDSLFLYIDDGTTKTKVWEIGGQQQTASADPYILQSVDLSAFIGSTINLNFVGRRTIGFANDMALDDIEVQACVPQVVDMGADSILAPMDSSGCYTAAETIDVLITNKSLSIHDFTTDSVLVTVNVTGATTATLTEWISTGTLAGSASQTVSMSTTLDMTIAGTYNITAYTMTMADVDSTNDTMSYVAIYTAGAGAGSIEANPGVLCVSGTSDISFNGLPGVSVQYQEAASATGPWTNVGAGGPVYTTGTLTSTTYFRGLYSCNGSMDSTAVDTVVVNNPMITATMGDTLCGSDTAMLSASGTGASLNWYDAPTAGNLLDTGSTFMPFVSMTDTFYVAPLDGEGKVIITEVCQFTTASYTNPGAPYPTSMDDPIEITNIGTAPIDISGWQLEVTGGTPGTVTIPAGNVLPAGGAFVLDRSFTVSPAIPNVYLHTGINSSGSGTACGYILSDAAGAVQDVTATNSFAVVGTGTPAATASDWTGTTGASGGTGGIRRTALDDTNDGSDWTIATGANATNYGTINVAFTPAGCEGSRVAVIVVSNPATPITASADTVVCWDGSVAVPLTVSSTNTTYTYTWSPATGLDVTTGDSVNANPVAPTQYVVIGQDPTGCGNTDTINVGIVDTFWVATSSNPEYVCGVDTITIMAMDSIPPFDYCASGSTSPADTKIDTVSINGTVTGTAGIPGPSEQYTDNTGIIVPVTAGSPFPISITKGSASVNTYASWTKVFIDLDQNGVFDPTEEFTSAAAGAFGSGNFTVFDTLTIPTSALNGQTRMRVVMEEGGSDAATAACGTFTWGETEDYTVDISGGVTVVGPAYTYEWMPGMLMGATQTVSPTATTMYSVTQTDAFGCSAVDTLTVDVGAVSGILSQATATNASSTAGSQSQMYPQADGTMISYFDTACNLIVTVDDGAGGNVLGNTMSEVTVEPTVQVYQGQPYVRRWFEITPTSNGPADVTLYFTDADFADYNAASGSYDTIATNAGGATTTQICITQVSGGPLGTGTPTVHGPLTATWNAADSRWEVTFPVTGFSEFYCHTCNPLGSALPVTLSKFGVTKEGSVSLAAWITESERNNSHFNLQRSLDGNSFTTLGQVSTKAVNGNSDVALNYDFTDESPEIGHNYYRLEQVDQDGNLSYSKIVDVVWGADGSIVSIYPNPATDKLNVDVSISKVAQLEVRLLDMSGRVIKSTLQQTVKGMNNVTLDLSDIATGVYGVQIYQNNNLIHTSKVNKQDK